MYELSGEITVDALSTAPAQKSRRRQDIYADPVAGHHMQVPTLYTTPTAVQRRHVKDGTGIMDENGSFHKI